MVIVYKKDNENIVEISRSLREAQARYDLLLSKYGNSISSMAIIITSEHLFPYALKDQNSVKLGPESNILSFEQI